MNLHGLPPEPKSGASANSAISAFADRRGPICGANWEEACLHDEPRGVAAFNGRVSLIMLVGGTHEAYYHKKLFNSNPNKFIILTLYFYLKEVFTCRKYLIF